MLATVIWLAFIAAAVYLVFYVFFPLGRGAIYDPSTPEQTRQMVELAAVQPGEKAADLGSGDGRVVIELARRGAEAHGWEVNPVLVLVSRRNVRRAGLAGRAFIHWGSFWRADFTGFALVTTFQVDFVMGRMAQKLSRELRPGARVVSHHWRFPAWPAEAVSGDMYLYRVGPPPGR